METEQVGQRSEKKVFWTEYSSRLRDVINRTKASEKEKDMAVAIASEIERQVSENLHLWDSKDQPGVSAVHTSVSLLELVSRLGTEEQKALAAKALEQKSKGELNQREWVLFPTVPLKQIVVSEKIPFGKQINEMEIYGADRSIMTALDIAQKYLIEGVYGVVKGLEAGKAEDLVFVSLSSPITPGGSITQEFLDRVRKDNFYWVEAEFNAEFLAEELKDQTKRLTLVGHSHAASEAQITALVLESNIGEQLLSENITITTEKEGVKKSHEKKRSRIRVLADDPVLTHGGEKDSKKKGIGTVMGAVASGAKNVWSKRKDILAKFYITKIYKDALEARGINIVDDEAQANLKSEAFDEVWEDFLQGPKRQADERLTPRRIPVYQRQGVFDETLQDQDLRKELEAHLKYQSISSPAVRDKNVRIWGYSGGHVLDRFSHPDRFIRSAKILLGEN